MLLIHSFRFWTREHGIFAFEHGFVSAIVAIMIKDPTWQTYEGTEYASFSHDSDPVLPLFMSVVRELLQHTLPSLKLDFNERKSS